MTTKLTFLGATETVTGSKFLLEVNQQKILVDCGLFQGQKELRLRNWAPLPINPSSIDAVVITHAHIDHTGYLPRLVKEGFHGPIYATKATYELCSVLLPDSGYIQEADARRANQYGYTKHQPALPLYTKADGEAVLKQFKIVEYGKHYSFFSDALVSWHRAGHILGASFIEFEIDGVKTVFTGDIGRPHDPIMKPPSIIESLDYLIIESTYGNRLHDTGHPKDKIADIINETIKHGGTILIPAFAVGRAQDILYFLYLLKSENKIPDIPVFLDSPMAINATEIFRKHLNEHKLSREECHLACDIATYTTTPDESKEIDQLVVPKIIISASGMLTGGRVLHHLNLLAPDHRNTVLLTGYQASGTRGDRMLRGEKEIKIFGQMIPINARVESLSNTSAHADYAEILEWLSHIKKPPRKVFIVHGESEGSQGLKKQIEDTFGWNCVIPTYLQEVELL